MRLSVDTNATYLVMEIIKNYFLHPKLYGIVVFYDFPIESSWNSEYLLGIENALQKFTLDYQMVVQWIRVDWSDGNGDHAHITNLLQQHIDTGCEAFITITKHLDTFLTLNFEIQQFSSQRIRDRKFLFLSDHFVDMDIFHHPAFNIYPHHLLVVPSNKSNNALDLLTQTFVGYANSQSPRLLDTFYLANCTFMTNADLYPDKLDNLEGRVVTVSAIEYYPYIFAARKEPNDNLYREWNSTGEKTIFFDGSEARLIINLCILRNSSDWGTVDVEEGIFDGQAGAVYLHKADIAVGSIGKWYFDYFEISAPIARAASTLAVPAPRPLSYFWTPILPFSLEIWLYFFGTLIFCIIFFYFVQIWSGLVVLEKNKFETTVVTGNGKKPSFGRTILEVIAVYLQQSVEVGSSKVAIRTVYGILLFAAIILENVYSGGLKSLLTVPRLVGRIDTIHDYVETNYAWGVPHLSFAYAVRLSQVRDSMLMYKRLQVLTHEQLHNKSLSGKYGVAVERLHSGRIASLDYITLETLDYLTILKDDLYFEFSNAMTIKGWPLMESFNKVILESMQHGLFVQWEIQISDRNLDFAIGRRLLELVEGIKEEPSPEILKIAHITGPLLMLAVGTVGALLAFIGEHVHFCFGNMITQQRRRIYKRMKNIFNNANY